MRSRPLFFAGVDVVCEVNIADEGRLKRSSLTKAATPCEDGIPAVVLEETGAGSECLQRNDRPPLPVINLQRPPHGLKKT